MSDSPSSPIQAPTDLLTTQQMRRLERMRLQPTGKRTARAGGEHRARRTGRSLEFRDHREYIAGDDIRFVDWHLFARLRRPYLKRFHEQEELHVMVLVDGSSSMQTGGKFQRAQQLAAAMGLMGLFGGEQVSVFGFHDGAVRPRPQRPLRGRAGVQAMLRRIQELPCGGPQALGPGLLDALTVHRGRGILVVISDFLTDRDLKVPFHRAAGAGLEVFGLQVLAPEEMEPDLDGDDFRLTDVETGTTLDISGVGDLLELYFEQLDGLQAEISRECAAHAGRYLQVSSAAPLDSILFQDLRQWGWVRG